MLGICGNFGGGKNPYNGQTIKTKVLSKELQKTLGVEYVINVDTDNWIKNPILLFVKCFKLIKKCDDIIILPAHNGIKVFIPLFTLLNKIYHKRLHYVVIGGWLPEFLESRIRLKSLISNFNNVFVETHSMIRGLEKQGLKNVRYLPNFKPLHILNEEQLIYSYSVPFKLCTFSRISKEKGIEDAIEAVKHVNDYLGFIAYTLDIYGKVDESYCEKFESLKQSFPEYISYKGIVNYDQSVSVLKDYFVLLFPTYYEGEGFAGTILDAYASGVPVIATNWRYNSEIIQHQVDGLIYDRLKTTELQDILTNIIKDPNVINKMKKNCLNRAKDYSPKVVINELKKYFN